MWSFPPRRVGAALALSVAACGGSAPTVRATARTVPECAVTAVVDVTTARATAVTVSFGAGASAWTSGRVAVAADGTASVPVFGLDPGATTVLHVTAFNDAGEAAAPDVSVTTAALPAGFPRLEVTTDDGSATGYLLLSVSDFRGVLTGGDIDGPALALAVDRRGRPMWYRDQSPSSTRAIDFQRQANGHFTVFQNTSLAFEEIDPRAQAVARRWSVPAPATTDGHDIELLPDGHALLLGVESRTADTTGLYREGHANAEVLTNSVVELGPDGAVAFEWHSAPEIGLDETRDFTVFLGDGLDSIHPNALSRMADGDLLVSFRQMDSVVAISRARSRIRWRLGGNRSDFRFADDPLDGFSHQHDARFLPDGHLLLLDNGNGHAPPVTRAVEYVVDEAAHTARLVWQYRHDPDIFSPLAGSARRLANGDTLVDFALQGLVTQVDAQGRVRWEAHVVDTSLYRALPVDALGAP